MTETDAIKNLTAYMYYALDELPADVGKAITAAIAALRKIDRGELPEVVCCGECESYNGYCAKHSDIRGKTEPLSMRPEDFCSYGRRNSDA